MENATKALLIAAAVLVAIIIISLTLTIVRQGQESVAGADLSEAEAAEFNSKFTTYAGNNVSTSQVNSLLNAVFAHNKQELASGDKRFVKVEVKEGNNVVNTIHNVEANVKTQNTVPTVSGSNYYKVECTYTGTIITAITVTKN